MVWSAKVGTGYSPGVVRYGRYFQFDRYGNVERLTCLNAETGKLIWKWESPVEYVDMYGYNNGPRTSPVVDDENVYVFGVAGTLAALRIKDGSVVWKRDTNADYGVIQNFFGVGSSPIVYNDLLLAMIGGSPAQSALVPQGNLDGVRPNGTGMVAFDKRTGKEMFRVGNYLASYSSPIVARFDDQDWCLALMREGLLMFEPANGSHEIFFPWRASILESVNAAWPVVLPENQIFISETYEIGSALLQFDGKTLKPLWTDKQTAKKQRAFRAHWATPVYHHGFLFGCSGRNEPDADYRSVAVADGTIQWTHRSRDRSTTLW